MQAIARARSKNSRILFIPNISNYLVVDYNIICYHVPNSSRKSIVSMLADAIRRGAMRLNDLACLVVVLFRCHVFIISQNSKSSRVFQIIY